MANGMRETQMRVWAQDSVEAVKKLGGNGGVGEMASELGDARGVKSRIDKARGSFEELDGNLKQIESKLKRLSDGRTNRTEERKLLMEIDSLVGKSLQQAQSATSDVRAFNDHCEEMSRILLRSAREHSEKLEEFRQQLKRQIQASR